MPKYIGVITTKVVIEETDIKMFFEMMNNAREELENTGRDYGECVVDLSQEIEYND